MANKTKFQAIKGTRDLLPPDTELWNRVEATAREVFSTFGFGEIRPPIFEPKELFDRSVGSETDIVSKEMYRTENQLESLRRLFVAETVYPFVKRDGSQITRTLLLLQILVNEARSYIESKEIESKPENIAAIKQIDDILILAYKTWANAQVSDAAFTKFLVQAGELAKQLVIENICLRPEATASVCRAYIEHGMHAWPQPVKLYYMGPMFRRERPQKGRYRQFYQIGAEVLETVQPGQGGAKDIPKDAAVDAEVIEMVMTFFARLGLEGVQLEINSIGHAAENCRRGYVQKLKAALEQVKDKLGPDSQRRIETNPLRVLDSKLESEQAIIAGLPKISEHLCDDCAKQYAEVKRQLDLRGVKYAENWRLVRGLDYYMRTTFEITAKGLGSQNAVCGGGRYDGLVELLGGLPTKGIGFAIGEDRLILSLQEQAKEVASGESRVASEEKKEERGKESSERKETGAKIPCDVYVAWMGPSTQSAAIGAAQRLRAAGVRVELPPVEQKFGKALGQADKLGARYALILGEDEVESGQWTVKTLADGSQAKMSEAEFLEKLKQGRTMSS